MQKNSSVIDMKPENKGVFDVKAKNASIIDWHPRNDTRSASQTTDQLYTQVLGKGMYMGIPPFTYTEAGTVLSSFSP